MLLLLLVVVVIVVVSVSSVSSSSSSRREGGGSVDVVAVDVRNWPWLSVHLDSYDCIHSSQTFFFVFTRNTMTIFGLPVSVVTIDDWTTKPFHTPLFT